MADDVSSVKPVKKLNLTITTPRGLKFTETCDLVIMRAIDGDLGIQPGHAPLITVLGDGVMRIHNDGVEKQLAVFGGVADVEDNQIKVYSTIAQRPDEIDLERAEEDRITAEEALAEKCEDQMTKRLEVMQYRALVRLQVARSNDFFDESVDDDDEDS